MIVVIYISKVVIIIVVKVIVQREKHFGRESNALSLNVFHLAHYFGTGSLSSAVISIHRKLMSHICAELWLMCSIIV